MSHSSEGGRTSDAPKHETLNERLWSKEQYYEWARSFGEDEKWVDEHFEFQPDGTTVTLGDIFLYGRGLLELPKGWARVEGHCDLSHNRLTSLAGAPETVGGGFLCDNNELTSLAGAPESIGGDFWCFNNQLTSLAGAPESVGGNFTCSNNLLTSLAGTPKRVGGYFDCSHNSQLTTLDDLTTDVGMRIFVRDVPLTLEAMDRAKVKWGRALVN